VQTEELMLKAMNYAYPGEIPIGVWFLPGAWMRHERELLRLAKKYPGLYGEIPDDYDYRKNISQTYHTGSYTDEWGCVWTNIEEGINAIVTGHPLRRRGDIPGLKVPDPLGATLLEGFTLPHGFMYLRLLDLRGFEEAMLDFAEECEELQILIDKVTEFNCRQLEAALPGSGPVLYFGDDLGTQRGLAIGPEKWRKYLFPAFKKIYSVAKSAGKKVYMHTDGMIYEIIPDLFLAGVDMVNPQYRANGLGNLVRVCKGRYPVNLDLDRQMFPLATPKECAEHVRECVEALYLPSGGLGITIEIGADVPVANIEALMGAADEYRYYKR